MRKATQKSQVTPKEQVKKKQLQAELFTDSYETVKKATATKVGKTSTAKPIRGKSTKPEGKAASPQAQNLQNSTSKSTCPSSGKARKTVKKIEDSEVGFIVSQEDGESGNENQDPNRHLHRSKAALKKKVPARTVKCLRKEIQSSESTETLNCKPIIETEVMKMVSKSKETKGTKSLKARPQHQEDSEVDFIEMCEEDLNKNKSEIDEQLLSSTSVPSTKTTKKRESSLQMQQYKQYGEKEVKDLIQSIMDYIVSDLQQERLFNKSVVKAGSCATKTNIEKASDYDFNVSVVVNNQQTETEDTIREECDDERKPLSKKMVIRRKSKNDKGNEIPSGYAILYDTDGVMHPRKVMEQLYIYLVQAVKDLQIKNVKVSDVPHGPAIGLTIRGEYQRNIEVDLTPIVNLKDMTVKNWPNSKSTVFDTSKKREERIVTKVKSMKLQLVPKKPLFWLISYARPMKELMKMIDPARECRKKCHKRLKEEFQQWKVAYKTRFDGISTYLFVHHLLWVNENFCKENEWNDRNIEECYVKLLQDLSQCLGKYEINHYFTGKNLLDKEKYEESYDKLRRALNNRVCEVIDNGRL